MTQFFVDSYALFGELISASALPRLTINTEAGDWPQAEASILARLAITRSPSPPPLPIEHAHYVGCYQPPSGFPEPYNTPFAVESVGDELRLHLVFRADFRLVPETAERFRVRTKPWVVEFVRDNTGHATAAVYPFITHTRHVCPRISTVAVRPVLK